MAPTLTTELILEILDALSTPDPPYATLASCSIVCKAWSRYAQRLLFRKVKIHNDPRVRSVLYSDYNTTGLIIRRPRFNRMSSFLGAIYLSTEVGQYLADSVHAITFLCGTATSSSDLALALSRTKNLRHLDVSTTDCAFEEETLLALQSANLHLTSMRILVDQHIGSPAQNASRMHRLVASIPTLRMLEIYDHSTAPLVPFTPAPKAPLTSVRFDTYASDVSACLSSLMAPPNGPDTPHLQSFWYGGAISPDSLRAIFPTHGPHLRSLGLGITPHSDVDLLRLCTRLESFHSHVYPSPQLLAALPRTIKELTIAGQPRSRHDARAFRLGPLIEQLLDFPSLEIFDWFEYKDHPHISSLRDMCNTRGIKFRALEGRQRDQWWNIHG
ncbi:hypothetical protein C8J57DRAFT_1305130 [Mycena rebaudengoi]|nr:hypothetical protein C8J57DRAFT_1305130 [Mycena rebaudengoi]